VTEIYSTSDDSNGDYGSNMWPIFTTVQLLMDLFKTTRFPDETRCVLMELL